MLKRLVSHHRPEVRAADADIDHVANPFAGVTLPRPAANAAREPGHLIEHRVDFGDDILAVHKDGCVARRAQRHVQHRPVFREIDLLAPEHGLDARPQPGFLGQLHQQLECPVRDTVLRVIEEKPHRLRRQALPAFGVSGEQLAKLPLPRLLVMGSKRLPGRALCQRFDIGFHLRDPAPFTGRNSD